MASFAFLKSASVLLLCMVIAASVAEAAITCGTVTGSLAGCIPYARGMVQAPPSSCCGGIRSVNSAARTSADRQTVCKCLKTIASGVTGINYGAVAGLPGKCGVNVPFKISPSTDCNSVK